MLYDHHDTIYLENIFLIIKFYLNKHDLSLIRMYIISFEDFNINKKALILDTVSIFKMKKYSFMALRFCLLAARCCLQMVALNQQVHTASF